MVAAMKKAACAILLLLCGSPAFAGASQFVRPEDVASSMACGPDLDELAESARAFIEAGYTDIAIVQVGDEGQDDFLAQAAGPLLDKLRALDRG